MQNQYFELRCSQQATVCGETSWEGAYGCQETSRLLFDPRVRLWPWFKTKHPSRKNRLRKPHFCHKVSKHMVSWRTEQNAEGKQAIFRSSKIIRVFWLFIGNKIRKSKCLSTKFWENRFHKRSAGFRTGENKYLFSEEWTTKMVKFLEMPKLMWLIISLRNYDNFYKWKVWDFCWKRIKINWWFQNLLV